MMLDMQVPPTVLVRVSHPIFHTAGNTDAANDGGCLGGSAMAPEGKLGSLQVRGKPLFVSLSLFVAVVHPVC